MALIIDMKAFPSVLCVRPTSFPVINQRNPEKKDRFRWFLPYKPNFLSATNMKPISILDIFRIFEAEILKVEKNGKEING